MYLKEQKCQKSKKSFLYLNLSLYNNFKTSHPLYVPIGLLGDNCYKESPSDRLCVQELSCGETVRELDVIIVGKESPLWSSNSRLLILLALEFFTFLFFSFLSSRGFDSFNIRLFKPPNFRLLQYPTF